ncbi:MAG: polysaccharide pyruvyl transferase family protein [Mucilaginibacter sp.]
MKITLIHCYSDFNKGDLGIILSTIDKIKELSPGCQIDGVSTYDSGHTQFANDHKILRQYLNTIYPCIFGLLYFKIGGKEYNSGPLKLLKFILSIIRLGPLLVLPTSKGLLKLLLKKEEYNTFHNLLSSDLIVSKGGSFLCNENNFRSKTAFFRLVYINLLLKKYNKKYIILGQSLGPVYGTNSRKIFNRVLEGADKVFLREKLCLEKYPYIDKKNISEIIVNDVAFTLKHSTIVENSIFDAPGLKIGLTVKFPAENGPYNEMMLNTIIHFIEKYNAIFIVYPQVTVDRDIEKAKELYYLLDDRYKSNFNVFSNNYTPFELRYMYSKMDLLVGTRLHSTIFNTSAGCPSINIEYHGTKSLGIYQELGLAELVITKENFNSTYLINKIENVLANKQAYKEKIQAQLQVINGNINKALSPYIK